MHGVVRRLDVCNDEQFSSIQTSDQTVRSGQSRPVGTSAAFGNEPADLGGMDGSYNVSNDTLFEEALMCGMIPSSEKI